MYGRGRVLIVSFVKGGTFVESELAKGSKGRGGTLRRKFVFLGVGRSSEDPGPETSRSQKIGQFTPLASWDVGGRIPGVLFNRVRPTGLGCVQRLPLR